MLILIIAAVLVVVGIVLIIVGKKKAASKAASTLDAEQELRYMKATPIQDAVEIVEELDTQSMGYRHYAELNGVSGTDERVVGPYSKREVAYYEVKCYQVTRTNTGTEEKLLAHEKSFAPFWLKDSSGDTKVYVDMNSFGNDVLLINSCNRMEGPNSEFAQQALGLTSSSTKPFGMPVNCMPDETVSHVTAGGLAYGFAKGLRGVLDPGAASRRPAQAATPALAYAGAGCYGTSDGWNEGPAGRVSDSFGYEDRRYGDNVTYAHAPGRPVGGGHRPGAPVPNFGGMGGHPRGGGYDLGDLVGDLVIGGMLASLLSQSTEGDRVNTETFMGYRIVENVIPLNSAVYTTGDLYKNGDRFTVGRSTNTEGKPSYFSARPEAEVISNMKKTKKGAGNPFLGFAVVLFIAAALCVGYFAISSGNSSTAPANRVTNGTAPTGHGQGSNNPDDYYYENGMTYWYDESTGYWYDEYGNAYYDEDSYGW